MKDLFDREFSDATGNLDPSYLLKSGPKVPFHPERPTDPETAKHYDEEEDRLKQIEEFLKQIEEHAEGLRDGMATLIERDQAHVQKVVDKKEEISRPRDMVDRRPSLADLGSGDIGIDNDILKDMSQQLDRTGDWTARFAQAALHKGSLYTHDIYMFQQQMRTNQLLFELLKEWKGAAGMSAKIADTEVGPDGTTLHKQVISLSELGNQLGMAPERYNASMKAAMGEDEVDRATSGRGARTHDVGTRDKKKGKTSTADRTKHDREVLNGDQPTRMRDLALLHGQFVGDLDQMMWKFQHFRGRAVADAVKKLSGGLLGISAFTPLAMDIAEAVKYQQVIRQIAYQTEGITAEMGKQQWMFEARSELLRTALASGQRLAIVEKAYIKNLQSGYKTQKDTLKVTRAGLTASTLIGSNAEETASYFHEMHMSLMLSAEQMASIGRGIQMTARYSKITGESLMNAVKAAKPFLDVMKQSGSLDAGAASNVIGMTAEMQKLGITDSMAPVMKALGSMTEFINAPFEARNLAAILSGGMPAMGAGTFKDKTAMRAMADRADDFLQQTFGFTTATMEQASVQAREQANWALRATMGVGLKDFAQFAETLRKQARPLGEKLSDIDKQIARTTKYDSTQRNELINEKENLRQGVRLEASTKLEELMKRMGEGYGVRETLRTASAEDAASLTSSLRELIAGDRYRFEQVGITEATVAGPMGTEKALRQMYLDAINRTNERLRTNTLGSDDQFIMESPEKLLQQAFSDTTGAAMRDLISKMSVAEQAAAKRELEEQDPVVAALGKLEAINAQIATGVGKTVSVLTGILGEVGIIALALGAMSADLMVAFGGNLFGKAAGKAGRMARSSEMGGRAAAEALAAGGGSHLGHVDRLKGRAYTQIYESVRPEAYREHSRQYFNEALASGMDRRAAAKLARERARGTSHAVAASAAHQGSKGIRSHRLLGNNPFTPPAFGEGRMAFGLSDMPRRLKARSRRARQSVKGFMNKMGGEAMTALEVFGPKGPGPFRAVRGVHDGLKGGFSHFGRSVGNLVTGAPGAAFRGVKAVGKAAAESRVGRALGGSYIGKAFESVFDPNTSAIGKFFGRTLPGFVKSAFDPKMMRARVMMGFDWMAGNKGPLKWLKDQATGDTRLGRGLSATRDYFTSNTTMGGRAVRAVGRGAKTAAETAKGKVADWGSALASSPLGTALMEKAGGAKKGLKAAGGSIDKFLSGKMGGGEAIFRLARMQEKIPVWGKFASMFGAGAQIAEATGGIGMMSGTTGAAAAGAAGASASGTAIASLATKAILPVAIITTAALSMKQGLESAAKAEKLFGKETEEIDATYRKAAESAGFLTGILNTLTFGVFDHWIGATGTLTSALAIFLKDWPILTAAIQAVMVPVKVVYGILVGLWEFTKEVFGGIWDGIKAALEPLNEVVIHFQNAFMPVWQQLSEAFQPVVKALEPFLGEMSDSASIIGVVSGLFKGLGWALGWVFRGLGMFVGLLMKAVVPVITTAIDIIAAVVSAGIKIVRPFISAVSTMFTGVVDTVMGFVKLIKGIFTLDGDILYEAMGLLYKGITGILGGMGEFIIASFYNLAVAIPSMVLNALGALVSGVWNWVARLGKMVGSFIGKIVNLIMWSFKAWMEFSDFIGSKLVGVGDFFNKILSGDWSGAWRKLTDNFVAAVSTWPTRIKDALLSIPGMLYDAIVGVFTKFDQWAEANLPFYGAAKGAVKAMGGAVGRVGDAYNQGGMWQAAGQTWNETGGAALGWAGGKIGDAWNSFAGMLGFAKGGVVTSPGLAMVGEAGPEVIIPIDELKGMFAKGNDGGVKRTSALQTAANVASTAFNVVTAPTRAAFDIAGSVFGGLKNLLGFGDKKQGKDTSSIEKVSETFSEMVIEPLQMVGERFSFAQVGIDKLGTVINNMSGGKLGEFWELFKRGWASSTKDVPKGWAETITSYITRIGETVLQGAGNIVVNVANAPIQMAAAAGNRVMENTDWVAKEQGIPAATQVAVGNAVLGAGEFVAATGQKIKDTFGWIINGAMGLLGFAEGGVVTKPGLAMVGEAGPEVIIPIKDLQNVAAGGTVGLDFAMPEPPMAPVPLHPSEMPISTMTTAEVNEILRSRGIAETSLSPSPAGTLAPSSGGVRVAPNPNGIDFGSPAIPLMRVAQQDIIDAHKTGAEVFCKHLEKEHKHIYLDAVRYTMDQAGGSDLIPHLRDPNYVPVGGPIPGRASTYIVNPSGVPPAPRLTSVAVPSETPPISPPPAPPATPAPSAPKVREIYIDPVSPSRASIIARDAAIARGETVVQPKPPAQVSAGGGLYTQQPGETAEQYARRMEHVRRGTISTGGGVIGNEMPPPIGKIITSLSPRDLMKERGGKEVTDTNPLPAPYPPGWGEKMVDGSLIVTYDPVMFPIPGEPPKTPPDPMSVEDMVISPPPVPTMGPNPASMIPTAPPTTTIEPAKVLPVPGRDPISDFQRSMDAGRGVSTPQPPVHPSLEPSFEMPEPPMAPVPMLPEEMPGSTMTSAEVMDRLMPQGMDVFVKNHPSSIIDRPLPALPPLPDRPPFGSELDMPPVPMAPVEDNLVPNRFGEWVDRSLITREDRYSGILAREQVMLQRSAEEGASSVVPIPTKDERLGSIREMIMAERLSAWPTEITGPTKEERLQGIRDRYMQIPAPRMPDGPDAFVQPSKNERLQTIRDRELGLMTPTVEATPIPTKDERLGSIRAMAAAELLRWPTEAAKPMKDERYNRILNEELARMAKPAVPLVRPQDAPVIPVTPSMGEPPISIDAPFQKAMSETMEGFRKDAEVASIPVSPEPIGSINIPLMRPDALPTPDAMGDRLSTGLIRRASTASQTVGEMTSPTSTARTTGVTAAASYSSLFDEDGNRMSTGTAVMEPVPLQDIHERIQREVASAQPVNVNASSPEMAEVAEDTDQMVELMKEFNDNMKKLLEMFKPNNSSGNNGVDGASTRSRMKPASTPQYHQLSFGRFRDSAVKGVINDGVS